MKTREGTWTGALARIPWQYFGTLTFAGGVPRPSVRRQRLKLWLNRVAQASGKRSAGELVYFVRPECGELGGRAHYHPLFAGLPSFMYNWFIQGNGRMSQVVRTARSSGFGLCTFRTVGERDSAVMYVSDYSGADSYEMLKSGRSEEPILSPYLQILLTREHEMLRFLRNRVA